MNVAHSESVYFASIGVHRTHVHRTAPTIPNFSSAVTNCSIEDNHNLLLIFIWCLRANFTHFDLFSAGLTQPFQPVQLAPEHIFVKILENFLKTRTHTNMMDEDF